MSNDVNQVENREDALFAMLIEKCMEKEGERYLALNEELKKNPEGIVPPGAYKRGLRTIDRAFRKKWCQKAGRVTAKILTRIAVAVCCLVLLFATAFAVSPAVREYVYTLVMEVMADSTELTLVGEASIDSLQADLNDEVSVCGYSEPVLPDGFELVNSIEEETFFWRLYSNENGANIRVEIAMADTSLSQRVDTEGTTVEKEVVCSDFTGLYVEKEAMSALYLADTERGMYISIICEEVDEETMLAIANQLQYIG